MSDDQDQPIWTRPERPARGPRPAYSRARITETAVAIADAEGIAAASMRRIAADLGTGAMSLYRYVPSRDDLVELMVEHAFGELDLPDRPSGDWRADLRLGAHRQHDALLRHPWLVDVLRVRPAFGPHQLRYIEFMMGSLDVGIPIDDIMTYAGLVSSFVTDAARDELQWAEITRRTGRTEAEWMRANAAYVASVVESGRYPMMTRIVRDARRPHLPAGQRFEHDLERVLDCVAAMLPPA
ncbi:TetR/AcrR family transcriptional regulator [Actinomadura atramentaria]|uniref:TetR/AcrR family transcriptional regulator n=1 Tax=Actinomadura atramentaria TaxID=1990 RepID=UPI0003A5BC52|nr:TetR/AcrR family transcriptional regulator [Actinomadura atramentaria]